MHDFWKEISNHAFSDDQGIQTYQTNFQAAKLKALSENFPLTKMLIGDSFFKAIIKHFIQNIASTNDSLNLYGKEFPDFVKAIIPYNSSLIGKDYLVDCACLDWAVMQSYFAEDDDPSINWSLRSEQSAYLEIAKHVEHIRFERFIETNLHSANAKQKTQFTSLEFNAYIIDLIEDLTKKNIQFDVAQKLLVYRVEFEVNVMLLSDIEDRLFLLLRERTPLFLLEEKLSHIASPELINQMIIKFKDAGILIGISEPYND